MRSFYLHINHNRQFHKATGGSLLILVVLAVLASVTVVAPFAAGATKQYSKNDCTWAVRWFNNSLSLFMERGYIEKISVQEEPITIYVGRKWYALEMIQQAGFLKNFARARAIIGHDPSCKVVDIDTGATVARTTPYDVEIILPDGNVQVYQIQDSGTASE